ncbi:hypothetical protein [Paracoccus denitrificans]|nr:hypothetical protein [Paracoccus denitrificans]
MVLAESGMRRPAPRDQAMPRPAMALARAGIAAMDRLGRMF